ncbi:MAG: cobalt-precorrin 5A hydrolase [Romboutsia sp.]
MNIDSKVAIVCITENGKSLACKIQSLMDECEIYFVKNQKDQSKKYIFQIKQKLSLEDNNEKEVKVNIINNGLKAFIGEMFDKYDCIVFIMATGIVVRTISEYISSKFSDPAILVIDERGKNVISLLSGHIGGANEMTIKISKLINSNPVITTATDINEKSSLDMIAKKLDGYIENFRDCVKDINTMLVDEKNIGIYIDGDYDVDTRGFNVLDNSKKFEDLYKEQDLSNLEKIVIISNKSSLECDLYEDKIINLIPRDIVVGIGCRRNIDSNHLKSSLEKFLYENNIHKNAIKEIGSIDIKSDEQGIIDLSIDLKVPFKTVSTENISQVDALFEKSDWVKQNVGVYSVAEPVAYILSEGNLIIQKQKYEGITFSIGRAKI